MISTVAIIVCKEALLEERAVHLISLFMSSMCPFKGQITQHYELTRLSPMLIIVSIFNVVGDLNRHEKSFQQAYGM